MLEAHNGVHKEIKMKITGHYANDAMIRQLTEAVIIKETDPSLNKKEEWGNRNVPRERKRKTNNALNSENWFYAGKSAGK